MRDIQLLNQMPRPERRDSFYEAPEGGPDLERDLFSDIS